MLVTRIIGNCPGCGGASCFGNVDVYGDRLLRGCQRCRHHENIPLPPLRKKVVYLDQCFFSGAFRGNDDRFVSAAARIARAAHQQLVVVPFSSIHEDETHQWERRNELEEFIKATSRGHEFTPAYDVERTQILKGFRAWLKNAPPGYVLEEADALDAKIHDWDGYFRIDVGRYLGDRDLIRELKSESVEGLVSLFDGWRQSESAFEADVRAELSVAGKHYIDSYIEFMVRVGQGDYSALFNSPIASMVVQGMLHRLPHDTPPDQALQKCAAFFQSDHFAVLPYQDIRARTFATLKKIVRGGAYTNKERALERLSGFFYDVKHIATYAPYSALFVMDKPMAELMAHPDVALEQRYGVRVISLSNWDDFFGWLDALEGTMDDWHKAGLAAVYP